MTISGPWGLPGLTKEAWILYPPSFRARDGHPPTQARDQCHRRSRVVPEKPLCDIHVTLQQDQTDRPAARRRNRRWRSDDQRRSPCGSPRTWIPCCPPGARCRRLTQRAHSEPRMQRTRHTDELIQLLLKQILFLAIQIGHPSSKSSPRFGVVCFNSMY
jgi:hypothetical protein